MQTVDGLYSEASYRYLFRYIREMQICLHIDDLLGGTNAPDGTQSLQSLQRRMAPLRPASSIAAAQELVDMGKI
jgi:hypothetical protein